MADFYFYFLSTIFTSINTQKCVFRKFGIDGWRTEKKNKFFLNFFVPRKYKWKWSTTMSKKIYPKDFEIVMKYIGNLIKVCSDSKVGGLAAV